MIQMVIMEIIGTDCFILSNNSDGSFLNGSKQNKNKYHNSVLEWRRNNRTDDSKRYIARLFKYRIYYFRWRFDRWNFGYYP